jgi:hypothetical protein
MTGRLRCFLGFHDEKKVRRVHRISMWKGGSIVRYAGKEWELWWLCRRCKRERGRV